MAETDPAIDGHARVIEKHGDPSLGPYGLAFAFCHHGGNVVAEAMRRWPEAGDPRVQALADALGNGRSTIDVLFDGRLIRRGWAPGAPEATTDPPELLLVAIGEVLRRALRLPPETTNPPWWELDMDDGERLAALWRELDALPLSPPGIRANAEQVAEALERIGNLLGPPGFAPSSPSLTAEQARRLVSELRALPRPKREDRYLEGWYDAVEQCVGRASSLAERSGA